jgi:hypothetical protein
MRKLDIQNQENKLDLAWPIVSLTFGYLPTFGLHASLAVASDSPPPLNFWTHQINSLLNFPKQSTHKMQELVWLCSAFR